MQLGLDQIIKGPDRRYSSVEICAGAGGQAIGLDKAGFDHLALVEIDPWACQTLRDNRDDWNVVQVDVRDFVRKEARCYRGVDLVSGGVPCPPFSVAGRRLGSDDDRDLFPAALDLVAATEPRAVMLENVRGLLSPEFDSYRDQLRVRLKGMGYESMWELLNASDFGVPQLRPRAILVALREDAWPHFRWPDRDKDLPPTVGERAGGVCGLPDPATDRDPRWGRAGTARRL